MWQNEKDWHQGGSLGQKNGFKEVCRRGGRVSEESEKAPFVYSRPSHGALHIGEHSRKRVPGGHHQQGTAGATRRCTVIAHPLSQGNVSEVEGRMLKVQEGKEMLEPH